MAKKRTAPRRKAHPPARLVTPASTPRTGVGTPDEHVAPAGVALGGDTGDVGTPRTTLGGAEGSTYGTSGEPEWSTVWEGPEKPVRSKRAA